MIVYQPIKRRLHKIAGRNTLKFPHVAAFSDLKKISRRLNELQRASQKQPTFREPNSRIGNSRQMDGSDIRQQLPGSLADLQPSHLQTLPPDGNIPSQLAPEFDPNNPQNLQPFATAIGGIQDNHLTSASAFVRQPQPGDELDKQVTRQSVLQPRQSTNDQYDALQHLQRPLEGNPVVPPQNGTGASSGHLGGVKLIPEPPNLEAWREKLFNVNETITLTEEEYVDQCGTPINLSCAYLPR